VACKPLAARAARDGVTESDVVRSALAVALGNKVTIPSVLPSREGDAPLAKPHVKLSIRLTNVAALRLDRNAHGAGLSRGAYLTRLIHGAPPVLASSDRAALRNALNNSPAKLAIMSRDINHLTRLKRRGAVEAARAVQRIDKPIVARGIGQLRAAGEVGIADRDGALGRRLQLGRETRCTPPHGVLVKTCVAWSDRSA